MTCFDILNIEYNEEGYLLDFGLPDTMRICVKEGDNWSHTEEAIRKQINNMEELYANDVKVVDFTAFYEGTDKPLRGNYEAETFEASGKSKIPFDVINIEYQDESNFDEMNPSDSLLNWPYTLTVSAKHDENKHFSFTEDAIRAELESYISLQEGEPVKVVDFTAFYEGTDKPLRGNYEDYEADTFEAREKKIGGQTIAKNPNSPTRTSLKAYMKTSKGELRKIFGNPNYEGMTGEGSYNLVLGGKRVTIYDYRESGKRGMKYFHVGGDSWYAPIILAQIISAHRGEKVYAKEISPKWLEDERRHEQVQSIDGHPDLTYEKAKRYHDYRYKSAETLDMMGKGISAIVTDDKSPTYIDVLIFDKDGLAFEGRLEGLNRKVKPSFANAGLFSFEPIGNGQASAMYVKNGKAFIGSVEKTSSRPFDIETFEARTKRKSFTDPFIEYDDEWPYEAKTDADKLREDVASSKMVDVPDGKHDSRRWERYARKRKGRKRPNNPKKTDWDNQSLGQDFFKKRQQGKDDMRMLKRDAETDLGFKEWADQEMKTHGKKESFDDWLDDELKSHGDDITLQDWGHHELDSHYERYGAESFEDFKRKMVGDNFIAGDVGYMEALEDFYGEYLEEFEEITDEFCPKPETFEEFQERVLKNDYERYGAEGFRTMGGRGFQIAFKNGYIISIMFGDGNYGDHYNNPDFDYEDSKEYLESSQAEVAILKPDGQIMLDVFGWTSPDFVAALIPVVAKGDEAEIIEVIQNREHREAEDLNWGGDPKGKLATALRNARIKAKQPKKPLKIEKLDGETFEADNFGDMEYIILSMLTDEQLEEEYGDYMRGYGIGRKDLPQRLQDDYLTDAEAKYLREKYLREDGEECESCGDTEAKGKTDVHGYFCNPCREEYPEDFNAEYDIQNTAITTIVADNEDEVWDKFTGDRVDYHDSMWQIVDVRDAETSGQWEIGEQLEEAQMNAEDKKRRKVSGVLSDPFDELSLDSGGIKRGIIGLGIVGLTILGIKKLRK